MTTQSPPITATNRGDSHVYVLNNPVIEQIEIPTTGHGNMVIRTADLDLKAAQKSLDQGGLDAATQERLEAVLGLPSEIASTLLKVPGVTQVANNARSKLGNGYEFVIYAGEGFESQRALEALTTIANPNQPSEKLLSPSELLDMENVQATRGGWTMKV